MDRGGVAVDLDIPHRVVEAVQVRAHEVAGVDAKGLEVFPGVLLDGADELVVAGLDGGELLAHALPDDLLVGRPGRAARECDCEDQQCCGHGRGCELLAHGWFLSPSAPLSVPKHT